ncbi:MAG: peptide-methionine (S)-S-oxide reductase MsrA [Alphaproteobacteria bacterium]|nr:peptide-methionine (S)-S-oxide reductase MsrA [Alphaproteobacteria bacterium]
MRPRSRALPAALALTALALTALALVAVSAAGRTQQAAPATGASGGKTATAIFAGGCFWCMEPPFDQLDGVVSTTSGYIGGMRVNPKYEEVSAGTTGHTEAVKIVYDPSRISYERLLHVFWRNHDPLTAAGQFCDKGTQYRPGIYYATDEERRLAEESKAALEGSRRFDKPIVTEIVAATPFYPAEEYHQDYYLKNPLRYKLYSTSCGRARRLKQLWGEEAGGQS